MAEVKLTTEDVAKYKVNHASLIALTNTPGLPTSNFYINMLEYILKYDYSGKSATITDPSFLLNWNTLTSEGLKLLIKKEDSE